MKVTLFTSSDIRHNYLVSVISQNCDKLFVIQETSLNSKYDLQKQSSKSHEIQGYFEKVYDAQVKIFGNKKSINFPNNAKLINLKKNELNNIPLDVLSEFLESDIYIIFGSSYIKGPLVNFLISKKAINIHMGVSPFYRGCDCNFWALYDNNPHLVGATIQYLSKGLDNGPILYHAMSNIKENPFIYTMSTVKSAFLSIGERLKNRSLLKLNSIIQDKSNQIRYSRKSEFSNEIVSEYFSRKIDLNFKKFNYGMLKDPFFLNK